MKEQLIKKDCITGTYSNMYPITHLGAIKDLSSGKTLDKILEEYNHIYLPFKDNSKSSTRLQIPPNIRRRGLWITYTTCSGNLVTEWYNSDDFSNKSWSNSNNWVPYLNKIEIRNIINDLLSWYKV